MDVSTIGFLVVVVLASGLIAYFADWLGRKLGKKRLTIGRLRPRHTAALGTTLSGMIISALTIVLVMAVSSDVRDWILRGNEAIRQYEAAIAKRDEVQKQLTKAQDLLKGAEGRSRQMAGNIKALEEQEKGLRETIRAAQQNLASSQKELASAREELASARATLATATREKANVEQQLSASNTKLAAASKKMAVAVRQERFAVRQYNLVSNKTVELDQQIMKLEKDRDAKQNELEARKTELVALDKQLTDIRKTLSTTQQDLLTTSEKLDDAQASLEMTNMRLEHAKAEVTRTLAGLEGNLLNTRWKPMVLPGGEEMARIQLPPNQTPDQVRAALLSVEQASRKAAQDRGVAPRAGTPAASIKNQMVNGKVVTVEEQRQSVIRVASGLQEESVIIASSFWNVFAQEDVPLLVSAYRNPLVYKQGQIVAETRIDGNKDDGVILKQLNEFISDKVKQKALADKMIPAAGSVGEVKFEELLGLARDIKETNRRVRLVAVTKHDTRAADPLKLDFRIR